MKPVTRIVLGLVCVLIVAPTLFTKRSRSDLHILLEAAKHLEARQPVYRLTDPNEHTKPPLATLLFVPLSKFSLESVSIFWDLMNLSFFVWFLPFLFRRLARPPNIARKTVFVLCAFILLNPLNQELRLGQYNLLSFALMALAAWGEGAAFGGIFCAIALLLKPTNLVFLPWVFFSRRKKGAFVASFALFLTLLAVIYARRYGISALDNDHLAWLKFLGPSTEKHVLRGDNFGIVRWLVDWHMKAIVPYHQLALLVLATAIGYRMPRRADGLALLGVIAILISPMAWFQNYVLLIPFVMMVMGEGKARVAALALLFVGVGVFNPTVCGLADITRKFCQAPWPLLGLLASFGVWARARLARRSTPSP